MNLCLEVEVVAGHEMVCILPEHGRQFNNNGQVAPWVNSRGAPSKWRRHFFQRRFPCSEH